MDLSRSLIRDFAKMANQKDSDEDKNKYVRGTIQSVGDDKFVKIDGSESLTPIKEVVDAQDGDRVLVSIENHSATILGNFTFPPSARKEQEAIDKAEDANSTANNANNNANEANNKAQDAATKADEAINIASGVEGIANEAKESAQGAIDSANAASKKADEAKQAADSVSEKADEAIQKAGEAQQAVAGAQDEINRINGEVVGVQTDINSALDELAKQAGEIEATKETMELNYAKIEYVDSEISNIDVGGRNFLKRTEEGIELIGSDFSSNVALESGRITILQNGKGNAYVGSPNLLTIPISDITDMIGEPFTYGADIKITGNITNLLVGFDIRGVGSEDKAIDINITPNPIEYDKWIRVYGTDKVKSTTGQMDRVFVIISWDDASPNSVIEYRLFKFEKGNKATDWSPAPEDSAEVLSEVEATLRTEISKKVGELQTTVEETYAAKTEVVEMEGRLQSQITQNQESITSQVSKIEQLEADTTEAKEQVDIALDKASQAQTAADAAQSYANTAQTAADEAKANADLASQKAAAAQSKADEATAAANAADQKVQSAQSDLNEAKQNLENVTNRVGATESEIADAQSKVDQAQKDVNQALADAAEANLAASNAQTAADNAQADAAQAQTDAANAQQKADNAQNVANAAKENADQALEDVAALTKRVTTAETKISQNAEAISLTATKTEEIGTKLDNLDVGGRNLLKYTRDFSTSDLDGGLISSGISIVEEEYKGLKVRGTTNVPVNSASLYFAKYKKKGIQYKEKYTFSFFAKGTVSSFTVFFYGPDGYVKAKPIDWSDGIVSLNAHFADGNISFKPTTSWKRYWVVYELGSTGDISVGKYALIRSDGNTVSNANFYICGLKLESGNKATDWSPAPEDIENDLHNNYYTKTETEAKIKVSADSITSTVSSKITEEISKVEVGGRNMFVNSIDYRKDTPFSTTSKAEDNYMVSFNGKRIYSKESFKAGDIITIQAKSNLPWTSMHGSSYGTVGFWLYLGTLSQILSGNYTYPWFIPYDNVSKEFKKTITMRNVPGVSDIYVCFRFNSYPNGTDEITAKFWDLKLEKGNKATDWSPAPEDMATYEDAANAQDSADKANAMSESNSVRITQSESQIKQLSNTISTLVTDGKGNSMMTQTSEGWRFDISSITDSLEEAKDSISQVSDTVNGVDKLVGELDSAIDDLGKKTAYITMTTDDTGAPCIELGKSDNPFKIRITNTSVDFMEGSNKIAYVSNKTLYIEKAIIKDELQIGEGSGFVWKRRSNGNMGLRWVD